MISPRILELLVKGLVPLLALILVFAMGLYTGQKRAQAACELRVVAGMRANLEVTQRASQSVFDAAYTTLTDDALTARILQEITDANSRLDAGCSLDADRLRALDALGRP